MKYLLGFLTISLLGLVSCVAYQSVSYTPEEYPFKVIQCKGSKAELFTKANTWMVNTFNDAESVIEHSDKEEGVILGKYLLSGDRTIGLYNTTTDTRIFAIIDIRLRDDKAKIEIKPTGSWQYDSSGMTIYNFSKTNADQAMNNLIQEFETYLTSTANDDW